MSDVRILVVDDNDVFRKMLRVTLVTAGYEVEEAANGKAAIASYLQRPSDLVITDLVMPDKEGLETIRELRQLDPLVRIIAMSGSGRATGYLGMAEKLGAQQVLQKPFTTDTLLTAVRETLA